jgi:hypothetical protein
LVKNKIYDIVHCEWNDWTIGACTKSCGGGTRTNNRTIKVSEEHGGNKCNGTASVEEICNSQECPGYKILPSSNLIRHLFK